MLFIIPLSCFVFIFLSLLNMRLGQDEKSPRLAFLFTSLVFGLLVVISIELLSFFQSLTFIWLLVFWSVVLAVSLGVFLKYKKSRNASACFDFYGFFKSEIFLLSGIALIIVLTGFVAIKSAPNNWDSMTYHMARVVHWIQHKSVSNYPSHAIRQLTYAPLAEFFIFVFQVLTNSDKFANLIQWFFMAGSVIGVSLIAKQLGAGRLTQIFSSVFAVTIPMGILQASSTQNDYALSFFLVCFVYFLLLFKEEDRMLYALAAGVSLGLAILTKGTAYIFAFPFCVWFVINCISSRGVKAIKPFVIIGVCVLLINAGAYERMFDLNARFLPGKESPKAVSELYNVKSFLSNAVRNSAFHFGSSSKKINERVTSVINGMHSVLGIDSSKPRTTISDGGFRILTHPFHEDHAGNFVHFILILFCGAGFFLSKKLRNDKKLMVYFLLLASAVLMFNICLKWQQWGSRLQLPIFVLFSPFVGMVLSSSLKKKGTIAVSVLLLIFSLPWVFCNQSRAMIGRVNIFNTPRAGQYFINRPSLKKHYVNTVDYLNSKNCSDIGLETGPDDWEYPFYVLFKDRGQDTVRIDHINVENISSKYSFKHDFYDFSPCAIINIGSPKGLKVVHKNKFFVKTRVFNFIQVFMRDDSGELERENLIYHFNKSLEYTLKIAQIQQMFAKQGIGNEPKALNQLMLLRAYQQGEAGLVDTELLDFIYPELGTRFRNNLLVGLNLQIMGFRTADQAKYELGQRLIQQWDRWFLENRVPLMDVMGY